MPGLTGGGGIIGEGTGLRAEEDDQKRKKKMKDNDAKKSYWAGDYDGCFNHMFEGNDLEKGGPPASADPAGGRPPPSGLRPKNPRTPKFTPRKQRQAKAPKPQTVKALEDAALARLEESLEKGCTTKKAQAAASTPRARGAGMAGVSEAKHTQKFKPGQATHAEKQATRGAASRMAHGAAQKVKQVASQVGAGMRRPAMARSIECPHCEEGISKGYLIKSLQMLAKSEGIEGAEDLDEFVKGLIAGISGGKAAGVDSPGKVQEDIGGGHAMKKEHKQKGKAVGNAADQTHGKGSVGQMHSSSRSKAVAGEVQRQNTPTNPVSKSLFPIAESYQAVEYSYGTDGMVAKAIDEGNLHDSPVRNLQAEQEASFQDGTE